MAFLQWRRFGFFDKDVVRELDTGDVFSKFKDINITCCTSGRGQIVVGDDAGWIFQLNRQLQLSCFKGFERTVTHLHQLKQHSILVSVGEVIPGNSVVKVWNLDKEDKNGEPICTRTISLLPNNTETSVSAIAVHENMNLLALGYQNGSVLLIKGDITRDRGCKHKVLHESTTAVTGLEFRTVAKVTHLFITSSDNIFSYNISVKEKEQKCHLDNHGCLPRCTIMSDSRQEYQLVVARPEAVYFYQPDGRGPCLAFDGDKIMVHWFRSYLVIVSSQSLAMNIVTVYHIQHKFIAYSATIPAVIDVISEWGSLFVLGGDKKLYQLQEKDTQSKLDLLFKKSLYVLAIDLAKSQQYDEEGLVDIFRQYGDHLYAKGDHDGAILQYIKTIGKLEASYVIRKFLDAQRIHNLTAYLQVLHKQGLATEDHTTLLLNCYTKLKDKNKLDEFIMTTEGVIEFDIEIAIRVCRQAAYYGHALFLAEKHHQHDWYLKLQVEDQKDYHKALDYIAKLEFEEAESNMKKYGKVLLSEVPEKTTEFLKCLCTDYKPNNKPLIETSNEVQRAEAREFIHIFVNNSKKLMEFLEHMIRVQPNNQSLVFNTLIELYLQEYVHEQNPNKKKIQEQKLMSLLQSPDAGYDIDQVLVLCQINEFKLGILYLYEKAKLYQQILRYYMDNNDFENIIGTCKKFGSQDSNLWIQSLWFFSLANDSENTYLIEVLHYIEQNKLLPPLMVIEILCGRSTATLAVVKDYIIRQLQHENQQIAEDERLMQQYRTNTMKMKEEIEMIKTKAMIFKMAKCSACNQSLDLPTVHFLCQHSYHKQCFEGYADFEDECPSCLAENRKVLEIIRAQEEAKDLHEQFHRQLETSEDGFSIVADYFGQGVFNKITLVTNGATKSSSESIMPKPASEVIYKAKIATDVKPMPSYVPELKPGASSFLESNTGFRNSVESLSSSRAFPEPPPKAYTSIDPGYPDYKALPVSKLIPKSSKNVIEPAKIPSLPLKPTLPRVLIPVQPASVRSEQANVQRNSHKPKNPFEEGPNPFKDDYDDELNPFLDS